MGRRVGALVGTVLAEEMPNSRFARVWVFDAGTKSVKVVYPEPEPGLATGLRE